MTDDPQPLFPLPRSGGDRPDHPDPEQFPNYPDIGSASPRADLAGSSSGTQSGLDVPGSQVPHQTRPGGYPKIGVTSSPGRNTPSPGGPAGPARGPSPQQWAIIAAALLAVFAIVLGAIVVSNNSGDAPGASDGPRASGGLSLSPDSSDELAACATPPDMQATSVTDGTGGLTVVTRLRPSCTDGDLLGNNEFRLTVVDAAGRDVAAGLFDLSGNPVPLVGEGTSVTFTFPPGTYWRTADAITGDVQMVAFNDGQESADAGSVSGSAFTAFGPTMPASGDLDAAAHSALVDIAIADLASIDASLLNIWQPQLSSKRPGLFADGVSWNYAEIVREHLELRQRFPSARLVWSGDWPVYSEPNWWITVSGIPFGSGPAALDWCASQGFDGDHCFAKLLSHTMGTSGTTVLRR